MMRRPLAPPPKSGPRYNEFITVPKVRVIDGEGENLGVMFTQEAIEQAADVGLDLVEVSPTADPPVCKFLDIGKFKYEAQKKANIARKTQKTQELKEIKMRPNIDDHDYDTKMKKVHDFIGDGDKVKITLRFRGRELSHQQLGMNLLQRVAENDRLGVAMTIEQGLQCCHAFRQAFHGKGHIFYDHRGPGRTHGPHGRKGAFTKIPVLSDAQAIASKAGTAPACRQLLQYRYYLVAVTAQCVGHFSADIHQQHPPLWW